ncbi:uncharacterized protein CTRU02_208711 [Colletotrichum truncatum]|uniref:Uncharacterized protein n=1 Tax=Colletotrichum truncatum TaxID=5467 RepID=A0ACC3YX19_COLTU|nr:uncharacterized protein CTRU02_06631 [Colletotrichum truncatum]KAF6792548.1 hypothetical protein CTRU02_06631 [Colletotrichum truncatum]
MGSSRGLFEEEETNNRLADNNNIGFGPIGSSTPTSAQESKDSEPSTTNMSTFDIKIQPAVAYNPRGDYKDRVFPAIARWVQFNWTSTSSIDRISSLSAVWECVDEGMMNRTISFAKYDPYNLTELRPSGTNLFLSGELLEQKMFFASNFRLMIPSKRIASIGGKKTEWDGKDMRIVFTWNLDDRSGFTSSGLFTITDSEIESAEWNQTINKIGSKPNESSDIDMNSAGGPSSPGDAISTSTGATSTGPTVGATGAVSIPASGSASRNGGLGTPAIVGIVIGVLLGVAIFGGLIWFFLRRRRRAAHSPDGTYDSGNSPLEYIGDKETHARVTESPHSPYSDDGQQQRHLNIHGQEMDLPVSTASPTEGHAFVSYAEQDHTPNASRSVENLDRDGPRSSNPNLNSNVSHLIEDGMTEDEIRRLEEEERALDAAIEQAGQGQGQRR